jgi:hypothetical protein
MFFTCCGLLATLIFVCFERLRVTRAVLFRGVCTFVQDEHIRKDNHGLEGVERLALLCAFSANNMLNTEDCFGDSTAP